MGWMVWVEIDMDPSKAVWNSSEEVSPSWVSIAV